MRHIRHDLGQLKQPMPTKRRQPRPDISSRFLTPSMITFALFMSSTIRRRAATLRVTFSPSAASIVTADTRSDTSNAEHSGSTDAVGNFLSRELRRSGFGFEIDRLRMLFSTSQVRRFNDPRKISSPTTFAPTLAALTIPFLEELTLRIPRTALRATLSLVAAAALATTGSTLAQAQPARPASVTCSMGSDWNHITGDGVQIHTQPNAGSTVLGLAYRSGLFCDAGIAGNWVYGRYYPTGVTGWVYRAYVEPWA
ncbi:hypothetical protein [Kribbella kalugense]|nr:hypothetical protein [Kribbella kalugense]